MLTVYSIPPSLYSAKLRILLRHKQLEWTEALPPLGFETPGGPLESSIKTARW